MNGTSFNAADCLSGSHLLVLIALATWTKQIVVVSDLTARDAFRFFLSNEEHHIIELECGLVINIYLNLSVGLVLKYTSGKLEEY